MSLFHEVERSVATYLRAKGFVRSGHNYFYITNDIAFCIALDAPGGILYVTAYIMPLYIPCNSRYYTYGNRLNNVNSVMLPLLKKTDSQQKKNEWYNVLCKCIEEQILPFFQQIATPKSLVEYFEHRTTEITAFISCPKVFVERLKLYTYGFLGDCQKAKRAMASYRELLDANLFLVDAVCQRYLDEIATLDMILSGGIQDAAPFWADNIFATQQTL